MKHTESTNRKGDLAEYYAVTWLWDNGYEVFRNSGCSGPIDMVAMDSKGEIILIDVKTARLKPTADNPEGTINSRVRTKRQKKLGVRFLLFNPINRSLRFVDHEKVLDNKEGDKIESN